MVEIKSALNKKISYQFLLTIYFFRTVRNQFLRLIEVEEKMRKLFSEIISYFNPIFLYYTIFYGAGKIYEVTTGNESIWQTIWNKYMDYFGENEAFHCTFAINFFTIILYWGLGAILFTMQKLKIPKSLANFKIQPRESEIEKGEYLSDVRFNINSKGHFCNFLCNCR